MWDVAVIINTLIALCLICIARRTQLLLITFTMALSQQVKTVCHCDNMNNIRILKLNQLNGIQPSLFLEFTLVLL